MITQEKIEEIANRIAINYKPEKIILFGSYAHGIPSGGSDLDLLVVVKKSRLPRYQRAREVRKFLWGISDVPKDILIYTQEEINEWKGVKEAFITSILKTGKIVYEKQEGPGKELA